MNARVLGVVALLLVAGVAAAPAAAAPSPPPAAFYGSLTVNGDPAPAGLTVEAVVDGESRGTLTTDAEGRYGDPGAFDAKLTADGSSADDGATVAFRVNGAAAAQTAVWRAGTVTRVDLSVTGAVAPPTTTTTPAPTTTAPTTTRSGTGGGSSGGGGGAASPPTTTAAPPAPDAGAGARVDLSVTRGADGAVSTHVALSGVESNRSVRVDLRNATGANASDPDVVADGLDVSFRRSGNASLDVTTSATARANASAAFAVGNGTRALGYITVDHDVPDADVGDVTFRFRVRKAALAPDAPESVALHRYERGVWTALPTTLVDETATHYVFAAESPGLSEFVVASTPAAADGGSTPTATPSSTTTTGADAGTPTTTGESSGFGVALALAALGGALLLARR